MKLSDTLQLNNEQCVLFLKQINNNDKKIINPKTGRELKNKTTINKLVKFCNEKNGNNNNNNIEETKFDRIKNILREKANKAKKRVEDENNKLFVSEEHLKVCKDAAMIQDELKKYDKIKSHIITLNVNPTHRIRMKLYKTVISDEYINRLTIPISQDYISRLQKWLQSSDKFVQKLSGDEIAALRTYTGSYYDLITQYMVKSPDTNKFYFTHNKYYLKKFVQTKNFSEKSPFFKQIINVLRKILGYKVPNHKGINSTDVKILDNVKSGKYDEHFISIDFTKKVIYEYIQFIVSIFKKAPRIDNDYYFYRGTKTDFYLKGSKDSIYENPTMASFSVIPEIATSFMSATHKPYACCIQIAKVMKGIPAIYVGGMSDHPHEHEVILPPNFSYLIKTARTKANVINENVQTGSACNKYYPATVSNVIIISHNFKKTVKN